MPSPKVFFSLSLLFLGIGLVMFILQKTNFTYHNPLDFSFKGERFKFYFPLGSSILLSVVISLLFYLFKKL